jgi:hypothetical protein
MEGGMAWLPGRRRDVAKAGGGGTAAGLLHHWRRILVASFRRDLAPQSPRWQEKGGGGSWFLETTVAIFGRDVTF